jgi:hypothetical protein
MSIDERKKNTLGQSRKKAYRRMAALQGSGGRGRATRLLLLMSYISSNPFSRNVARFGSRDGLAGHDLCCLCSCWCVQKFGTRFGANLCLTIDIALFMQALEMASMSEPPLAVTMSYQMALCSLTLCTMVATFSYEKIQSRLFYLDLLLTLFCLFACLYIRPTQSSTLGKSSSFRSLPPLIRNSLHR